MNGENKLPNKEFKVMTTKMLKEFERKIDVHSEKLHSESRENHQTIQV